MRFFGFLSRTAIWFIGFGDGVRGLCRSHGRVAYGTGVQGGKGLHQRRRCWRVYIALHRLGSKYYHGHCYPVGSAYLGSQSLETVTKDMK